MQLAKFFAAVVALAASTTLALELPDCAKPCVEEANKQTPCAITDIACQCEPANRAKIRSAGTPCVIKACGMKKAIGTWPVGSHYPMRTLEPPESKDCRVLTIRLALV
jgi:hypothetical protein